MKASTINTSLFATAAALRSGELKPTKLVEQACERIEAEEPKVLALLPENGRRARLLKAAAILESRYPDPVNRPPLHGVLLGVKDIFCADGFKTKAGSRLPEELFDGPEASAVTLLKQAGALILGKTVTTEFAYFVPGPTRNPRALEHTPGGSSSGSAAAVACGFCELALGTQTIGSVTRPASYCGVVGYKPSYERIPRDGVIPFSPSADHVGVFTKDAAGVTLAASVLCKDWKAVPVPSELPRLLVPDGPYLEQADSAMRAHFEAVVEKLEAAGLEVERVQSFADIEDINARHRAMIAAEFFQVHEEWFAKYETLYGDATRELIQKGRAVTRDSLDKARAGREELRDVLEEKLRERRAHLWLSPAATSTPPRGLLSTGSPLMNLPWTHAGLPTIALPAGKASDGLPAGIQLAAPFNDDENLSALAVRLEHALNGQG